MKAGTRELNQRPTTAEDDVLKRNTDCVYFLASPLTCKKGSECVYRHSEDARINPRDCWFWLNGNCLNAKCSFRHPPLDGMLGPKATSPVKLPVPPTQTAASAQLSAVHAPDYKSSKQATPCFYFQNGLCLKGDRCSFMHGPQPVDSLVPQPQLPKVPASVTEPQTVKKALWAPEKFTQQKKIIQANIIKPVVPPPAKQLTKAETALSKNGIVVEETMAPPISFDEDLPRYKPTKFPPVISANFVSRTDRGRQAQPSDDCHFSNGKGPDEFPREWSPGVDVLVADELWDSDYYQKADESRRMKAQGRHLDTVNEINYGHSADYNSLAKFNRETYNDPRGFDLYGQVQDQHAWEQRRASSERVSERPSVREKRGFMRAESPDQIVDGSDLRYRLSKQRRIDGSRAAVGSDHRGDFYRRDERGRHVEDQRYGSHSRRDSRRLLPHESSISNRLQGRISLLGRPSPDSSRNDSHLERERDRGRNRGRLSPGRPSTSSHQGRLQDRIKQRVQEDFTTEGRNFRGSSVRRDEVDNETLDFAGPKSLAELKGVKFSGCSVEQHTKGEQATLFGEQKNTEIGKLVGHHESESEGPKSLKVILKRKREEKGTDSGDDIFSGDGKSSEENQAMKQSDMPSESNKEVNQPALISKDRPWSTTAKTFGTVDEDGEEEEGLISADGDEFTHEGWSSAQKESEFETEDATLMDRVEDQELETFDQRDGHFDYEQVDGGDFKTEEDDMADPEDEYLDDEDGDDFAKRIGVMFS